MVLRIELDFLRARCKLLTAKTFRQQRTLSSSSARYSILGLWFTSSIRHCLQESGTGGSGCWRLAAASEGAPQNVQTAGEIVQENVWFSTAFNAYANDEDRLPFDHHMLAGLIAPRGLLSIDNAGYQWLGPCSSLGCMGTARLVWQAMGVPDRMGYSMSTNHPHCSFPDQQREDLFAFINRFLLGMEVNTTVQKNYAGIAFDNKPWVNWQVPNLT